MFGELTLLLKAASEGDQAALNRVIALLYVDLKQLAHRCRRGSAPLDTTSLVSECYLRLLNAGGLDVNDRGHFFNLAARIMRQLLCDHVRERLAEKRGGDAPHVEILESDLVERSEAERLLAIDQALARLAEIRPQEARVVECRFFAGLTEEYTAEALERSLSSVQRDWHSARDWLARKLEP